MLNKMMYADNEDDFVTSYNDFCVSFSEHKKFIAYFDTTWVRRKELWSKAWRKEASFDTNNLIETYHNQLKTYYLGRSRSLRVDKLIYMLSQMVTLDYRQDAIKVMCGFKKMNLTKQEKKKKSLADTMPISVATMMVNLKHEDETSSNMVSQAKK